MSQKSRFYFSVSLFKCHTSIDTLSQPTATTTLPPPLQQWHQNWSLTSASSTISLSLPLYHYHIFTTTLSITHFHYHFINTTFSLHHFHYHSFTTTIKLPLFNYNFSTTFFQLQLFNYNYSITTVQLPLFHNILLKPFFVLRCLFSFYVIRFQLSNLFPTFFLFHIVGLLAKLTAKISLGSEWL